MGYALWIDDELAWAAGAYEYRGLGVAVISKTDRFRARDFSRWRKPPPASAPGYAGQFASLVHLNAYLKSIRTRPRARGSGRI